MNEETKEPTTDTDGILDRCGRCGAFPRWITNGAECTECAECVIVPLSEGRDQIMTAWNKKQRKILAPVKEGVPIEHMATDTPEQAAVEPQKNNEEAK